MKCLAVTLLVFVAFFVPEKVFSANTVPAVVQMPGTQPMEVGNLESPDKCDNCHGGYNSAVEPAHNWRGSMMALAGRDPIFWATLAIAEQDFDGAGDLCLRCHSTGGWLAGRSTPTDGSGLAAGDSDGVECDYCHKLTNTDDSEYRGVMNEPFVANDGGSPAEGYYGSGMSSLWDGSDKLGPYLDADARHQFMRSEFHRKSAFCGTCHDVSNPVTGELAPGHGAFYPPDAATSVAYNNPPYRYGIVERTFSEHMASAWPDLRVDDLGALPEELRAGAVQAVYDAAYDPDRGTADYEDGTTRYFSCQTCHMRAVTGTGANKRGVPVRTDLPLHDMTGGNYWMPGAIEYLDGRGKLRLGGGLSSSQVQAMRDGALRALEQLQLAATLDLSGNTLKVINHTGHKLITGYPEGRRMWLNVKWYKAGPDGNAVILREDGEYGNLPVTMPGLNTVRTLLHPDDPNTFVYEAHMGMTPGWASGLIALGYDPGLALAFDRSNGQTTLTLGELATAGEPAETFHFALNDTVVEDNRIPPYGMKVTEAVRRNVSVDSSEYPATNGRYAHYDLVDLNPPPDAEWARIDLLYQPTSWEYIQFLYLANDGSSAFLGNEGANMLEAWLATGMAEPVAMASTTWGASGEDESCDLGAPSLNRADARDKSVELEWQAPTAAEGHRLYYDQSDKAQLIATLGCASGLCSFTDTGLTNGQSYCYKVAAFDDSCESGFSDVLCATPQPPGQQTASAAVMISDIGFYLAQGKGKHATREWQSGVHEFTAGTDVVFRLQAVDLNGNPVPGATVEIAIGGPETAVVSGTTGPDGAAEASWATGAPNKKGNGGTTPGAYTGTVGAFDANGFEWDGSADQETFEILP